MAFGWLVAKSFSNAKKKKQRPRNLAKFFAGSPLRGAKLKIKRIKGGVRGVEL